MRPLPTAALLLLLAPSVAVAADPPLRRVVLSTAGVAYLEREATVRGDATLELAVRRDQLDDVLKSLVVLDGAGTVAGVTLPGETSARDALAGLPFGPDALEGPGALLAALRGAEVRLPGPRTVVGRILSVERDERGRHRVTVATPAGLDGFVLEEAPGLAFADPGLGERIDRALARLSQDGDGQVRRLAVSLRGGGSRTVRLGYLVEAPVWKASWRLTLGPDGRGRLQGWAVVENMTGADWRGVDLALVSGDPVALRQALATPLHVDRPDVPVDAGGRLAPRPDAGPTGPVVAMAAPAPAPAPTASFRAEGRMRPAGTLADEPPPPAALPAAVAEAAVAQVVFRPAGPIEVPAGRAALLPLLDREVSAERVALWQRDVDARHPLAAIRLRPGGTETLPPGLVTVYASGTGGLSHAGDARMAAVPAGETRMLAVALDRELTVDRQETPGRAVSLAAVSGGVLRLTVTDRRETVYTVRSASGEARSIVLEHPRQSGWTPVVDGGAEASGDVWRIARPVPAGGTVAVRVTDERPRTETIDVGRLDADRLRAVATGGGLPAPLAAALAGVADLQGAVAAREAAIAALAEEAGRIAADQARIRENLAAVPADGDLARRYVASLGAQEDRMDAIRADETRLRAALAEARGRLAAAVRDLRA
ncbi:MAG: hypothetical protein ACK5YI_09500 [Rhodospirillales bacterium]|jgi:hypothetical protein